MVKNLPANAEDSRGEDLILGLGRSHGVGNGNSLQYYCLENSMEKRACWVTVHGVTKSQTQLSMHTPLPLPFFFLIILKQKHLKHLCSGKKKESKRPFISQNYQHCCSNSSKNGKETSTVLETLI